MTRLILNLIISICVSLITFIFLTVLTRRLFREKGYTRLDSVRERLAPVVLSLAESSPLPDVELLKSKHGSVEWRAVEELLFRALDKAPPEKKGKIQEYFESLGYADDYISKLKSKRPWERALSAERLGRIRCGRAVPELIGSLKDGSLDVVNMAVNSLGLIGDKGALPSVVDSLKKALNEDEEVSLRIVKSALISYGRQAKGLLLSELESTDWRVRAAVVDVLGEIDDPDLADVLIGALNDTEPDIRAKAAKGLGRLADKRAVGPLMNHTDEPYWVVRLHSLRALGLIGDPRSIDKIKVKLLDSNWQVRSAAAEALGRMKDRALPVLTEILLKSTDRYARDQVLEELQRSGLILEFIRSLADESKEVRENAEEALYAAGVSGALSPIINSLTEEDPELRGKIIRILGKIGSDRAVEVLKFTAENDDNPEVRQKAQDALKTISGQNP